MEKGKKISYTTKPYNLTKEEQEKEIADKSKELETRIKNRITQVQAILGKSNDIALPKGKGGDKE